MICFHYFGLCLLQVESVADKEETEETQKSDLNLELDSSETDKVKDDSEVAPTQEPTINGNVSNSFKPTNIHDLSDVLKKHIRESFLLWVPVLLSVLFLSKSC